MGARVTPNPSIERTSKNCFAAFRPPLMSNVRLRGVRSRQLEHGIHFIAAAARHRPLSTVNTVARFSSIARPSPPACRRGAIHPRHQFIVFATGSSALQIQAALRQVRMIASRRRPQTQYALRSRSAMPASRALAAECCAYLHFAALRSFAQPSAEPISALPQSNPSFNRTCHGRRLWPGAGALRSFSGAGPKPPAASRRLTLR